MVSGVVEAFVTPSGLPTWARVGIGASLWLAFLAYVFVLGGRAVRAGELGDLRRCRRAPTWRRAPGSNASGSEPAGGLEGQVAVGQVRRQRRRARVDHLDAAPAEQRGDPPPLARARSAAAAS